MTEHSDEFATAVLGQVVVAANAYLTAKDELLARYRTGSRPTEAQFRRLDVARSNWNQAEQAAARASHSDSSAASGADR